MDESKFFQKNNDDQNGSQKLNKIISMELTKKIKEKVPEMEAQITKNLSKMKTELNKIPDFTNEDFQAKLIAEVARKFGEEFNADIGYPSSAMLPDKLSHGAKIFKILNKWFSKNGIIWNDNQQQGARWYLQDPARQKRMLKAINLKQQNVRGGFNFTCPAEITMQGIIKSELDRMIEMPNQAIEELMSQLRESYIEICDVCFITTFNPWI